MKSHSLTFVFCFCISIVTCQSYFSSFNDIFPDQCPASGESIGSITNWEFFQTTNGDINGERTESCFDVISRNNLRINNAIDRQPIFLKSINDLNAELASNLTYLFSFSIRTSENNFCNCNFDCDLSNCISATIKLTSITGNDTFQYEKIITDPEIRSSNFNFTNCFLTENADKTILNGIEIEFTKEHYLENEELSFSTMDLFEFNAANFENRIIPNEFKVNSAYFVSPFFFNPYQFGSTIVTHQGQGIPSSQNIFYHDLIPEDSTTQQIINIVLEPSNSLLFQEFTGLRGAVIANSQDSLRHKFNLINEGSTICLLDIIEAIFNNNDSFIHKSGKIDFQSPTSCMQFKDQSKFTMKSNSYLKYGKNGNGLLALENQSQINLESNSKLSFDGEIILKPSNQNQMSIILNQGALLKFEPRSKISSKLNSDNIQLSVYLNGGTLDTSNLDLESLKYLNIIDYKKDHLESNYLNFNIYPNPTSDLITIKNTAPQKVKFEIISLAGKRTITTYIDSLNEKNIDLSNIQEGVYFVISSLGTQRKLVIER